MKTPRLRRYQRKGVFMLKRFGGRALLADDMGLGKTIQALQFMVDWHTYPTVVVCPASLKWNWEREVSRHFGLSAEILEGQKPPRINRRALKQPDIVIVNYDILRFWLNWLQALKPCLLIFDEAHYCGNLRAKRTKAVKKLAASCEYVLGLTGTPLVNRPAELWSILHIVRPDVYQFFRPFADLYCAPQLTPWGWQFKGATKLSHLHRSLRSSLMVRRTKTDVLHDLPANQQYVLLVDVSDPDRYKSAELDFLFWLAKERGIGTAKRAAAAEELVKWSYLKQLAAELKLKFVMEWIENFLASTDGKLVVFGIHHAVLRPIYDRFRQQAVIIDGSVTGRQRQQRVDSIQKDPRCRVCVGHIKAAGEGLNLTMPEAVLFAEIPWTSTAIDQAISRIHRIGQLQTTTTYFAVARNTIEGRLLDIIRRKARISKVAIDGQRHKLVTSVYDELRQQMCMGADR